jgi:hypothetical protein
MGIRLGVYQIIQSYYLDLIRILLEDAPKGEPSDAPETVDSNLYSHRSKSSFVRISVGALQGGDVPLGAHPSARPRIRPETIVL